MEKFIGQEYESLQERKQFLMDNADNIESIGYSKPIPSEQIEKLKETLADASIKKMDLEEEKKTRIQMLNDEIKEYKNTIKETADKLKSKSEYVNEPCFVMVNEQARQVGYYNELGMLVYERPARQSELQPRLFKMPAQNTGTDNQ